MIDDDAHAPSRRKFLLAAAVGATAAVLPGCRSASRAPRGAGVVTARDPVIDTRPLGFQWETFDPFLFCVHHDDAYPAGNARLGPAASLEGRTPGRDFEGRDGWRMYHGDVVPGFPQHPHRGFETVTVVRRGLVDHSDSLGARARYGGGDVQWLTAGAGIVHAEMFPLLDPARPNPLELFQIWLNLPRAAKFAAPHFSMFWRESIPTRVVTDARGARTTVTVIAGEIAGAGAPSPPPGSYASRAESDVAIWTLAMEPYASFTLPPAAAGTNRTAYFFRGDALGVGARTVPARTGVRLVGETQATLVNGSVPGEVLVLQGRPIGEPVVQRGPFVMSSEAEIAQAFADYRRTRFGGWPFPSHEPVHPPAAARFAVHADGREEVAG